MSQINVQYIIYSSWKLYFIGIIIAFYCYRGDALPVEQPIHSTQTTHPVLSPTHTTHPEPAGGRHITNQSPIHVGYLRPIETNQGRIFWDSIGNFISTSEWFPLEMNVPDTISTIGQGLNNMWSGFMVLMGDAQQVPREVYRVLRSVWRKAESKL